MQYAGLVTAMQAAEAYDNPGVTVYEGNSNFVIPFGFNCERPPFDNVNIRRAIIHALDLESIGLLNGGRKTPGSMLFNGFDNVYTDSPGFPEFDLDKAKELLAAEGYTPANPLRMETLFFRPDPGIELFQSDLKTVGVDLVINQVEFSVFLTKEGPGEFDGLWTSNPNRGGTWLTDLDRFDYDNFLGMRNLARWRNPRAQEIIAEMRTTTDAARLKALSTEINQIIGYEVPIVGVFFMPILSVMNKDLTGIEIKPNMQQNFRKAVYNG
jgi:ABC-type transport system substrate-binding protein